MIYLWTTVQFLVSSISKKKWKQKKKFRRAAVVIFHIVQKLRVIYLICQKHKHITFNNKEIVKYLIHFTGSPIKYEMKHGHKNKHKWTRRQRAHRTKTNSPTLWIDENKINRDNYQQNYWWCYRDFNTSDIIKFVVLFYI